MDHLPLHDSWLKSSEFFEAAILPHGYDIHLKSLLPYQHVDALRIIESAAGSPESIHSVLQQVLYFQLLETWFGTKINIESWSRTNDSGLLVLTSQCLPELLKTWSRSFRDTGLEQQNAIHEQKRQLLNLVSRISDPFVSECTPQTDTLTRRHEVGTATATSKDAVVFSIRILTATLEVALYSVTKSLADNLKKLCPDLANILPLRPHLTECFAKHGWCPHQVRTIWTDIPCITALYLLSLPRKERVKEEHIACLTNSSCTANALNIQTFRPRHTTPECDCAAISVDEKLVANSIEQGRVPLVVGASAKAEGISFFNFTERQPSTRYMTISHVWADGMGNPLVNSMPRCMFERLQAQLRDLPRSFNPQQFEAFGWKLDWPRQSFEKQDLEMTPQVWIDALCIPISDVHADQRRKAIDQMASIYAGAEQNLILDGELQQHNLEEASAMEIVARITVSNWMTRCWTLQEGVLGRECVFQFADAAIDPIRTWSSGGPRDTAYQGTNTFPDPDDLPATFVYRSIYDILWEKLREGTKMSIPREGNYHSLIHGKPLRFEEARSRSGVKRVAMGGFNASSLAREKHFDTLVTSASRCEQLVTAWNELAHRSTTKREDVATILANLLDFHVHGLQGSGGSGQAGNQSSLEASATRMKTMLLSFNELPISLLSQDGWEGQAAAFSWIPVAPITPISHANDAMIVAHDKLVIRRSKVTQHRLLLLRLTAIDDASVTIDNQLHQEQYEIDLSNMKNQLNALVNKGAGVLFVIFPSLETDASGQHKSAAALLHISSYNHTDLNSDTTQHVNLEAHYLGRVPISLNKPTDGPTKPACLTTSLPTNWQISIDLEGTTAVSLPRRTAPVVISKAASIHIVIFIFALAPMLACMIAFAIYQFRATPGLTPLTTKLLVAFLSLYIGSFVLGGGIVAIALPVARRAWMASFEPGWSPGRSYWLWWLWLGVTDPRKDVPVSQWVGERWGWVRGKVRRSTVQDAEIGVKAEDMALLRTLGLEKREDVAEVK
ncbi:Hypothetical protein D9617_2g056730 [Elsinoe fawcettii]|nr:Hypothetical protein D9617_2g056730 [Elsinoe fawcettii]